MADQQPADNARQQDVHQEMDARNNTVSIQTLSERLIYELRRLLAELLGTFALTVGGGSCDGEILLTFLLVTVVLGIATKGELVGNNVAIAIGGTVALCGLFAGRVGGASMNPARSLGPYLVSGQLEQAWIYVVAPFAGALLAAGIAWLLRGGTSPEAVKSATGEEHDPGRGSP